MLKHFLKSSFLLIFSLQSIKLLPGRLLKIFILFLLAGSALISTWFYFYILKDLPPTSSLTTQPIPQTTHIRDRTGVELYKIYSDQNRTLVKLSQLPPFLTQAVISIEDKNFYTHSGFSVTGFIRALFRNVEVILQNTSPDSFEGGSTITQQLVKTSLLSPEKTFRRKIKEFILALAIETKYSKKQILEMYLNRVSFGGSAYGIEEAAQTYFDISAKDLNPAQASLLAGLPAAPTFYSPYGAHPQIAKERQLEVLRQMVIANFLTPDQAASISATELIFHPPISDIKAPHFVMYVKDLLARQYGSLAVEQGGLDVTTSLDLSIQTQAEKIVAVETAKIAYLKVSNGAALITHPSTGEILAMVGSRDYFDLPKEGNVNVVISPRQPGSAIKPINYALAFSHGFTPASTIDDSPITFSFPNQPSYSPINYDGRFHGRITLRTALASSYNVPAVKLLAANGVTNMLNLGRQMGITTWTDPSRFGLSLTLGGGEVTMTDLAVAYGVFANLGKRVDLHPILSVRDSTGHLLEKYHPDLASSPTVLNPQIAYLLTSILSDNLARSPTFGYASDLYFPQSQVAVKTGTTNNLRDNWTIGYSPDHLVAVWVGNNDNSPMSYIASGVTGASPIWHQIMANLLAATPKSDFIIPPGLIKSVSCVTGRVEFYLPGTQPQLPCPNISPFPTQSVIRPPPVVLAATSAPVKPSPKQANQKHRR